MASNEYIEKIHVDTDMSFNQVCKFQQIANDRVAKNSEILNMLRKVMKQSDILRVDACNAVYEAIAYTEAEQRSWAELALNLNAIATQYLAERQRNKEA